MAKFKKGEGGRPKGSTNKVTKTVKEVVLAAFNELQEHPTSNILSWGINNPKDFYNVAAKLIPTEVSATVETIEKQEITLPGGTKIIL